MNNDPAAFVPVDVMIGLNRYRKRWDAVVGENGFLCPVLREGHPHTVRCFTNRLHRRSILNDAAEPFGEGVRNMVHAAYRLEHRHLLIEAFVEDRAAPEIRVQ